MLYFTLLIYVKEGKESIFQEFEELAIPIISDYNGTLLYRVRPQAENYIVREGEIPYEIHFLSFPCREDFMKFAKDGRRQSFLHLKEESIRATLLVQGEAI